MQRWLHCYECQEVCSAVSISLSLGRCPAECLSKVIARIRGCNAPRISRQLLLAQIVGMPL